MDKVSFKDDMKKCYLDYAMSVIVGRALPDVRDGLKPVQRRILYDMNELGITYEKGYKKCARTVGDVLGKYHPHGDSSVYEALVRMAQDFTMRYNLVDGHGNFGSIDGDSPASMRYTESKLAQISNEMLRDINKNTVDFIPNFDGEEVEPMLLPSRFPNLLVNGSSGIAVGFATNIPPHNLTDIINATIYQIDNPNCNIDNLIDIVKAPDFPTKAIIINPDEVREIYKNGEGKITIRGKYHIETVGKIKQIVFTEIPYGVDTSVLKDNLYNLIHGYTKKKKENKKIKEVTIPPVIPQISKMDDESNRNGIRLIFKLKKGEDENKVLALLFKHSKLQTNFCANFTAIINNDLKQKQELNLKNIIEYYIDYQREIITRRSQYDLTKANKRIHILEGLKIAIANMKKVIDIVEKSKNKKDSINNLITQLNLTEAQATAVVDLRLYRLSGIEIEDINKEYSQLKLQINELNEILSNKDKLNSALKTELTEIRNKYGDERKTEIIYEDDLQEISSDELIEDYNCRLILSSQGYLKKHLRQSDSHKLKDDDYIIQEIPSTNKSTILLFSDKGNRYKLNCYDLKTYEPKYYGDYTPNLIDLDKDERIISIASIENQEGYMLSVYENGHIAKVDIKSFMSANKKLLNCYSDKSKLLDIKYIKNDVDIMLLSSEGKLLIVNSSNINSVTSKNSQGVVGMKLDGNIVIKCIIDCNKDNKFTVTTKKGKAKEFSLDDIAPTNKPNEDRNIYNYCSGKRGNQGNFIWNLRNSNDEIIKAEIVEN